VGVTQELPFQVMLGPQVHMAMAVSQYWPPVQVGVDVTQELPFHVMPAPQVHMLPSQN
jgi:hypothetical protein